ncbi:hypothetical protein LV75_000660 [Actinokineospora diospyrosa]|uniref:Peptidase M48-like protein n=2 Tax=Actinokineospora diospyrosa TaxID=103728 RepID=A0ABT1I6H1_9PSEU|nr:hypothetical protein [Actinokineospora diospyrosa]
MLDLTDEQIRAVLAHHEAAHAVIMVRAGDQVRSVWVRRSLGGSYRGRTERAGRSLLGPDEWAISALAGPEGSALWATEALGMSLGAARIATARTGRGDVADARDYLHRKNATLSMPQATRAAQGQVAGEWRHIKAVAMEILAHGRVPGDKVRALAGPPRTSRGRR